MAGTGSTLHVHALKLHMSRGQFNPNYSKPPHVQRLCMCMSKLNPNLSKTAHAQKQFNPRPFLRLK